MRIRLLLTLILSLTITTVTPVTPPQQEPVPTVIDRLAVPVIVGGLAVFCWFTAPANVQASLRHQVTLPNLLLTIATEYGSWKLATFLHEFGHAAVAAYLFGQPTSVSFSALDPTQGDTKLESFLPLYQQQEAVASFITTYCHRHHLDAATLTVEQMTAIAHTPDFETFRKSMLPERKRYALFLMAGGLVSLLGHHLIQALINKHHRPLDSITINQLLLMLMPSGHDSDGSKLWSDCAEIAPRIIAFFEMIAPYLSFGGEIYGSVTDPCNTQGAPLHSKLLIGCLNFWLRGYLRFHA